MEAYGPEEGPYAMDLPRSARHPGEASNGCIVMPLNARQQIRGSGDHEVAVIQ